MGNRSFCCLAGIFERYRVSATAWWTWRATKFGVFGFAYILRCGHWYVLLCSIRITCWYWFEETSGGLVWKRECSIFPMLHSTPSEMQWAMLGLVRCFRLGHVQRALRCAARLWPRHRTAQPVRVWGGRKTESPSALLISPPFSRLPPTPLVPFPFRPRTCGQIEAGRGPSFVSTLDQVSPVTQLLESGGPNVET